MQIFDLEAFLQGGEPNPLTKTDSLHQLSIYAKDHYIFPQPSLFKFGSHLYLLDIAIGEIIKMDEGGTILDVGQVGNKDREKYIPIGYAAFDRTRPLTTVTHRNPFPGMVQHGEYFFTITRYHDEIRDKMRSVITRFQIGAQSERPRFSRFVIPGVDSKITLLDKQGKQADLL